jgi:hypothetical protein
MQQMESNITQTALKRISYYPVFKPDVVEREESELKQMDQPPHNYL